MTEDKQIRKENTIRFIKRKTLGWAMGVALLIIICVIVSSLAALIEAGIMLVLKCQFSPLRFLFFNDGNNIPIPYVDGYNRGH